MALAGKGRAASADVLVHVVGLNVSGKEQGKEPFLSLLSLHVVGLKKGFSYWATVHEQTTHLMRKRG
jgi:hypothetical protein